MIGGARRRNRSTARHRLGSPHLDTTDVVGPTPTPSFQVPPSVPPLQSQVSAPLDAGWGSRSPTPRQSSVTGLSAAIKVGDGAGARTYDLTGMSSHRYDLYLVSGPSKATCNIGTLPGEATDTLNVLVTTPDSLKVRPSPGSAERHLDKATSESSSLTGRQCRGDP